MAACVHRVVHARDASRADCRNSRRINNRGESTSTRASEEKNRREGGKTRGARKGTLPQWIQ